MDFLNLDSEFLPDTNIFSFLLDISIDVINTIKDFANDLLVFLFANLPFLPEGIEFRGIDLLGFLALAFIASKIASDLVIPDGGGN